MWAYDAIREWNENNDLHYTGENGEESFFNKCLFSVDIYRKV